MKNFRDIIDLWPSRTDFANDIGVSVQSATNMRTRNSIPAKYWVMLCDRAKVRDLHGVTPALLAALASES